MDGLIVTYAIWVAHFRLIIVSHANTMRIVIASCCKAVLYVHSLLRSCLFFFLITRF
jgi:hypothetical protein